MSDERPTWIYHDHMIHAFVFPEDRERGALVRSACGRHQQRSSGTKCMGASRCLDCAEALCMNLSEDEIRPKMGLGYRRPTRGDCAGGDCEHEAQPWPDTVGTTASGLVAPQSAIDAMKGKP